MKDRIKHNNSIHGERDSAKAHTNKRPIRLSNSNEVKQATLRYNQQ